MVPVIPPARTPPAPPTQIGSEDADASTPNRKATSGVSGAPVEVPQPRLEVVQDVPTLSSKPSPENTREWISDYLAVRTDWQTFDKVHAPPHVLAAKASAAKVAQDAAIFAAKENLGIQLQRAARSEFPSEKDAERAVFEAESLLRQAEGTPRGEAEVAWNAMFAVTDPLRQAARELDNAKLDPTDTHAIQVAQQKVDVAAAKVMEAARKNLAAVNAGFVDGVSRGNNDDIKACRDMAQDVASWLYVDHDGPGPGGT
jgi:hypothetical protein